MGAVPLNGHLPASELGTVEGLPLALKTINAYTRMKAAAKAAGVDIWIAQPIGGYRSFAVQADMKVNPAKYGLSTVSTVNVASAGYSTHGLGNALDIGSFGSAYGTAGAKRSDWLIRHAPEFGFYREFGDRDPNHFHHDGFTAVDPIITLASVTTTPIEAPKAKEWDEMATKDEIKQAVEEVVKATIGNLPANAIISYSSADPERNGIVLASPGRWHKFDGEEFQTVYQGTGLFNGVPIVTPVNDRHYDLIRAVYTNNDARQG